MVEILTIFVHPESLLAIPGVQQSQYMRGTLIPHGVRGIIIIVIINQSLRAFRRSNLEAWRLGGLEGNEKTVN